MKKTFNIGEYAVGGTIKVEIKNKSILISICDYKTNNVLYSFNFIGDSTLARHVMDTCLSEYTSSYYADKILDYICKAYLKINKESLK